ncbi:MAG: potassium-transporting ATPase subunit F [Isosphaeraceae bacterium]|nr:potassium-transporting ATPase subunit F [Isosphaeraceae bacterium]
MRPALIAGAPAMLYLIAILTVLALIYLGYAMIRPEHF